MYNLKKKNEKMMSIKKNINIHVYMVYTFRNKLTEIYQVRKMYIKNKTKTSTNLKKIYLI